MEQNYGSIHLILTGGTIDSYFDPTKDAIVVQKETTVEKYLEKLQLYNSFQVSIPFLKDSREITDKDRAQLFDIIKASPHHMILITHGTYTMPDTARYLKNKFKKIDKKIVLTGAMIPLKGFDQTDASFNLGYALAQLQTLPNGIYLCMNGKVFKPEEVTKNTGVGRFE